VTNPDTAPDASQSRLAASTAAPGVALALGMAGALGEELLAALVASPRYRLVQVALKHPVASGTAKYRPWLIGSSVIAADDAYLCVTPADTPVPRTSPVQTFDAEHLIDAARMAQDAGARRLVVVSPLSALLQMNAASHTVSSEHELALVQMKFETLVLVRPTETELAESSGAWIGRTVRSLGRMVLEIMLPAHVQALQPRTAAMAILTAVQRLPAGVYVIGARELLAVVEETLPALAPKRPRLR
jgi:mRNA-degrading endonuclease toxin of MazEF toxin-antitoxin module